MSTSVTLNWLIKKNQIVIQKELEAARFLEQGNTEAYVEALRQKAQFLATIADDVPQNDANLPANLAATVSRTVQGFAQGARAALSLNSSFYMSALLYPDEHVAGEPNNLTLLLQQVEQALAAKASTN